MRIHMFTNSELPPIFFRSAPEVKLYKKYNSDKVNSKLSVISEKE